MTARRRPRKCEDVVKATGLPCPTPAISRADPDGRWRCVQHSTRPDLAERIRVARSRGAFRAVEVIQGGPLVTEGTRYLSVESLDEVFDELITTCRLEARQRKSNKAALSTAVVALADAKIKVRQMAWLALAQRRLNPARETPA
jgi:hypothetical protein